MRQHLGAARLGRGGVAIQFWRGEPAGGVENGYTGYAELIGVGVATVPEPAAVVLFGVAMGLFLAVGAARKGR